MALIKTRWPFASLLIGALLILFYFAPPTPARVHDPSSIVKCKDEYWIYSTGAGVPSWHSRDLIHWQSGPRVFTYAPPWVRDISPMQRGYFWAPEVAHVNGQYYLYYAVSRWASRNSAIGLATNPTLDPTDPAYHWTDRGIVVRSFNSDNYNAIDPSVLFNADGRSWMTFGSFWTGIKLIELDSSTGLRKPGTPLRGLAWNKEIEASYILQHDGKYYLFVNWGLCCRGVLSTYEIRVGRSARATGPYMDKDGKDMMKGGGTLFLGREEPYIGPGQTGVLREGGAEWLTYHYYDARNNGQARLGMRKLQWDSAGWPVAGAYAAKVAPQLNHGSVVE